MHVERVIGALRGDLELRIAGEAGLPFGLADRIGLIVKRVLPGLLELLLVGVAPERNRAVVEHPLLGGVDEHTRVVRIVMPELLRHRRLRIRGRSNSPLIAIVLECGASSTRVPSISAQRSFFISGC